MFVRSADLYDPLYSFKDYRQEADLLTRMIRQNKPGSRSLLDIACGTAEHHKYLKTTFQTEGLDVNAAFIDIARDKNPECTYHLADMTDFDLGKQYDVVTCLFSSIGYLTTDTRLSAALSCMKRHLMPGGLLVIEPWFAPDQWKEGHTHMLTYTSDDMKVCRLSKSTTKDALSIVDFHYLFAKSDTGVQYFSERHELALRTHGQMMEVFLDAGLVVSWDEEGLTGRGIYIGVKNAE